MRYPLLGLPCAAVLMLAAAGACAAEQNPFVGTWHSSYVSAAAPSPLTVDDTLQINADGSFKETEHGGNLTTVVSGHYKIMPGNVLHLTAEQSEPKIPLEQLPPEDMHYQFTNPKQWTAVYDETVQGQKVQQIRQTFDRVQ